MKRIINILGGLGNQMFQYAFAIALHTEYPNDEVKINTYCFNGYKLHNGFEIEDIFPLVKLAHASKREIISVAWPWFHYRLWQIGSKILPERKKMTNTHKFKGEFNLSMIKDKCYFDGYWQAPKFFKAHKNVIKAKFQFLPIKEDDTLNKKAEIFIKQGKTAFIHVRRGDYLNHSIFGDICTLNYYRKALQKIQDEYGFKRFIIFSNDIAWCREHLNSLFHNDELLFVDWNKGKESYRDIQLMTFCDAGIIANSSFSWWGAWLSNAEIIISPEKWTNKPGILEDIIPENWIKIQSL